MKATLQKIKEEAIKDIKNAKSTSELDDVRVKYLGKKGVLQQYLEAWESYQARRDLL